MKIFSLLLFAFLLACSGGSVDKANFSGEWVLNQDKSDTGGGPGREGTQRNPEGRQGERRGGGFNAPQMTTSQTDELLTITRTFKGRDDEEITSEEKYNLTGKQSTNESRMGVKTSGAKWDNNGSVLVINSESMMERGDQSFTMTSTEKWTLLDNGNELEIEMIMSTPRGERTRKVYYTKN